MLCSNSGTTHYNFSLYFDTPRFCIELQIQTCNAHPNLPAHCRLQTEQFRHYSAELQHRTPGSNGKPTLGDFGLCSPSRRKKSENGGGKMKKSRFPHSPVKLSLDLIMHVLCSHNKGTKTNSPFQYRAVIEVFSLFYIIAPFTYARPLE